MNRSGVSNTSDESCREARVSDLPHAAKLTIARSNDIAKDRIRNDGNAVWFKCVENSEDLQSSKLEPRELRDSRFGSVDMASEIAGERMSGGRWHDFN